MNKYFAFFRLKLKAGQVFYFLGRVFSPIYLKLIQPTCQFKNNYQHLFNSNLLPKICLQQYNQPTKQWLKVIHETKLQTRA